MSNRYEGDDGQERVVRDALLIWDGASNPRGVARAVVEMIDWYCENGHGSAGCVRQAPLGLALAQLLWLCGFGVGDLPGVEVTDLARECRRVVEEEEAA